MKIKSRNNIKNNERNKFKQERLVKEDSHD